MSQSAVVTGAILAGLAVWLGESLWTPRGLLALLGGGAVGFALYSLLLWVVDRP